MKEDILQLINNLNDVLNKASVIEALEKKNGILRRENEKLRIAAEPKDCGHAEHIEALRGRIKELEVREHELANRLMQIQQELNA